MVRETPLHLGHLRTMTALAEMGAIIAPPVPALYARPDCVDALIDHTVGRVLDMFDLGCGAGPPVGRTGGRGRVGPWAAG